MVITIITIMIRPTIIELLKLHSQYHSFAY